MRRSWQATRTPLVKYELPTQRCMGAVQEGGFQLILVELVVFISILWLKRIALVVACRCIACIHC